MTLLLKQHTILLQTINFSLMAHTLSIEIKTNYEAFHRWKDAPDEVSFLRNKHRHIFYVELELTVSHNDRDFEFFIVKKDLDLVIRTCINKEDAGSCEMQAEIILKEMNELHYPVTRIKVSEDNENSAILTVTE